LELNPDQPARSGASPGVTGHAFDITRKSSSEAWAALSLYETSSSRFQGYARRFQPGRSGNGWAIGSLKVTASAAVDVWGASIGVDASGQSMRALFSNATSAAVADQFTLAAYAGSRWNLISGLDAGTGAGGPPDFPVMLGASGISGTTQLLSSLFWAPGFSQVVDSRGRILAFYVDRGDAIAVDHRAQVQVFDPGVQPALALRANSYMLGAELGLSQFEDVGTCGATKCVYPQVRAVADGTGRACAVFQYTDTGPAATDVRARCVTLSALDYANPAANYLPVGAPQSLTDTTLTGGAEQPALASDGEGHVLAMFYQYDSSGFGYAYSSLITDGVFASAPESAHAVIADADDGTYPFYTSDASAPYVAPAVTSLGSGKFLAVFVSGDGGSAEGLFSAVYTADEGWSDPQLIAETAWDQARTRFAHVSLVSDGIGGVGGSGNALLMVQWIASQDGGDSTGYSDVRRTLAARYDASAGWTSLTALDGVCTAYGTSTLMPYCTHPPRGVLFPSGEAVVLYQSQDIFGDYRLAASEFR